MISINVVGRLAFQPELKLLPKGSVCEFRVLDTRFAKGEEIVEAVTFFCYDELAEELCERCEKGQIIEATGAQETQRYKPQGSTEERIVVKYRLTWFKPGPKPRTPGGDGRPPAPPPRSDPQPARRATGSPPGARDRLAAPSQPPQDDSAKTGFF